MGQPPSDFAYRSTKSGKVFITWRGKLARTLIGADAARFLEACEGVDDTQLQHEMARVTGNFKRGNERILRKG